MPLEKNQKLASILQSEEFYPRGDNPSYLEKLKERALSKGREVWRQVKSFFRSDSDNSYSDSKYPGIFSNLMTGIAWLLLVVLLLVFIYSVVRPFLRAIRGSSPLGKSEGKFEKVEESVLSKKSLNQILNETGSKAALSELRSRLRKDIFAKSTIIAIQGLSDRALVRACDNLNLSETMEEVSIFRDTASIFEEATYADKEVNEQYISQLVSQYQSFGAS